MQRRETEYNSVDNIVSKLSLLYNSKIQAPTTLIELSVRDLKRFKENSIHLNGLLQVNGESKDSDQTIYSQVTYGSYLSISKKKLDIGEQKWYQYVNMDKTKNRYMIITANKSEYKNAFPNTFTYSTSMSEGGVTINKTDASHSGVVILVIVALPNIVNDSRYDGSWVNGLYNDVRSCKPNVLES